MNFLELEPTNLRHLVVVAAKDQVSSDLGDDAVILNLKTGIYHGLDSVGARIWSLIQESRSVNDILNTLLQEYEVEPDRCERELVALLQKLGDAGLIEVSNETTA
jgi:hypothetical protein